MEQKKVIQEIVNVLGVLLSMMAINYFYFGNESFKYVSLLFVLTGSIFLIKLNKGLRKD